MSGKKASLKWLWLSIIVVILDQVTKWASVSHLPLDEPKKLLPVFNLSLAYNRGSAFGFLDQPGMWQVVMFSVIALAVVAVLTVWLYRTPMVMRMRTSGIALIIGGAVGNLIDRARIHQVVDFLQFHIGNWYFPTFNLADTAITLGAICLILSLMIDE